MGRWQDVLEQAEQNPANVRFADLCKLLERAGYELARVKGSHHFYRHATRPSLPPMNLQRSKDGKAKPYQVKQVVRAIRDNGLEVE